MSDERILSVTGKRAFPLAHDDEGRSSGGRSRSASLLSWRQWSVFFGMGAAVIIIEVRNHTAMWADHHSGQTIWTDHELIGEIILFGLIFPLVAGIVFSYLMRTSFERDQIAKELQQRRELVERMNNAKSHQALAEVIVSVPGSTALAERAWLLAQQSGEDEFEQIAHWERPGSDLALAYPSVNPAVCEHCEKAQSLEGTRVLACHLSNPGQVTSHNNRYCLWLTSQSMGKATLLFETPAKHILNPREIKVLDDLGDEISLAIENANLLHLRQRQADAARDERLRIARNLHDTVGQNVSYLRLKLDQLRSTALTYEPIAFQEELANTLAVADEVYEQMRDTLDELRTPEHQDLEQTVRHYVTQSADRAGFSVYVHTNGQPKPLSPRKSRQVMYIVREALNNVEKHANAENVELLLQYGEDEFTLSVRDDGIGFQPEELEKENRYGMVIMRERASAINGNLAIESTPGGGTEVALRLPLSSGVATTAKRNP